MLNKKELADRVEPFIAKHEYDYNNNYELSNLIDEMPVSSFLYYNYQNAYYEPEENETIFTQLFAACDVLEKGKNPYYQMMKKIEKEYGLDRDIVEVGGGFIPTLAIEIAKRQKEIGKGSITVYDPNSTIKTTDDIKIIRRKFTLATPVKENDLLVGRKTCQATPTMIQVANRGNIEFYISLCNCDHTTQEYRLTHQGIKGYLWYYYLENLARDTLPDKFTFKREEEKSVINGTDITIIKTKRMK